MLEAQKEGSFTYKNDAALSAMSTSFYPKMDECQSVSLSKSTVNICLDSLGLERDIDGLFGVTLYNEVGPALSVSLASLAYGIEYLLLEPTIEPPKNITICILADGHAFLSNSIVSLIDKLGLGLTANKTIDAELTIHQKNISLSQLKSLANDIPNDVNIPESIWANALRQAIGDISNDADFSIETKVLPTVSLLFCIKKENAGKLDSHWWMYRGLSAYLRPKYCFQMDAGTALGLRAISDIWQKFETSDDVAGIASSIAPLAPSSYSNLLEQWQYANFSKTIFQDWPLEVASGHLSVIPGQFSGLKWQAVADENYDVNETGPLDVYFKGIGELSPYETMLYLAEDRVLCSELATANKHNWRLEYIASSEVVTDYCNSWPELYKQRKRWCAGYLACRLDFLARIPKFISDKEQLSKAKISKSIAASYHLLQLLMDWFIPALIVVCYGEMALRTLNLTSELPMLANTFKIFFGGTIAIMMVEIVFCLRGKLDSVALGVFRFSRLFQVIYLLLTGVCLVLVGQSSLEVILIIAIIVAIPLGATLNRDKRAKQTFYHCVLSAPFRPSMAFSLWTYAICNTHDNSWGTKGLDEPCYKDGSTSNADDSIKKRFLKFRNNVVVTWLFSNVLLVAILMTAFELVHLPVTLSILVILAFLALLPLALKRYGTFRTDKLAIKTPYRN